MTTSYIYASEWAAPDATEITSLCNVAQKQPLPQWQRQLVATQVASLVSSGIPIQVYKKRSFSFWKCLGNADLVLAITL